MLTVTVTGMRSSKLQVRNLMHVLVLTFAGLYICAALPVSSFAGAGDLDPTFGVGGKVVTEFVTGSVASAVVIQPDGKIVVAGVTDAGHRDDFALARYNTNGDLDSTFGSGGKVLTDFFGQDDVPGSIALQSDGKIVVAGTTFSPVTNFDFAVARYNSNGSLDSSFGIGGKVTTDFFGTANSGAGVAVQPDGKIVVSGSALNGAAGFDFALVRYNTDGSLDPAFGSGGKVVTDFLGTNDGSHAIALQPDGKIVAAGAADNGSTSIDIAVARFHADGSLDPGFGSGGKVLTDVLGFEDESFALAIQQDGKIVVAGRASDTFPGSLSLTVYAALVRYNPNGSADLSFGSGGKVISDFSSAAVNRRTESEAIVIETSDKIVTAGFTNGPNPFNGVTTEDFVIAKYTRDGQLDSTFGSAGRVVTDFTQGPIPSGDRAYGVALQGDGKIVAVGVSNGEEEGPNFTVVRYKNSPPFDYCIQNDSDGSLLQFNSVTGDYLFSDCRKGLRLSGRGTVTIRFCKIELQGNGVSNSANALVNSCTRVGSASIRDFSTGRAYSLSDKDMGNDTCICN